MKEKEEKLQKLYMEFQMLSNTIKQLDKQNDALESQLMELMTTNQSLEDMKKIDSGTEILVPISSGIYAKAELKESDKFIVNVGSSITLQKDADSTKQIIEKQIEEVRSLQENIVAQLQENTTKAGMMEQEMNKLASEVKSE